MISCKKCDSENVVKSGIIGGRQRFRCKKCNCNFRMGDNRTDEKIAAKKLLCVLLHFVTNSSYRTLGKLVQTDHSLVYRWIQEFDKNLLESQFFNKIKEPMEFDEMCQYVSSKKDSWSSNPVTVADGEIFPGHSAIVILRPSNNAKTP